MSFQLVPSHETTWVGTVVVGSLTQVTPGALRNAVSSLATRARSASAMPGESHTRTSGTSGAAHFTSLKKSPARITFVSPPITRAVARFQPSTCSTRMRAVLSLPFSGIRSSSQPRRNPVASPPCNAMPPSAVTSCTATVISLVVSWALLPNKGACRRSVEPAMTGSWSFPSVRNNARARRNTCSAGSLGLAVRSVFHSARVNAPCFCLLWLSSSVTS